MTEVKSLVFSIIYYRSAKNFDNFDLIGVPSSNYQAEYLKFNQNKHYHLVYRREKIPPSIITYYVIGNLGQDKIIGDEYDGSRSLGLPYSA